MELIFTVIILSVKINLEKHNFHKKHMMSCPKNKSYPVKQFKNFQGKTSGNQSLNISF